MSSSTARWIPELLAHNARIQALDASLESITTKLDAVLTDSLRVPRRPKRDLREFRKMVRKEHRHELANWVVSMPVEDASEDILFRAYELAIHGYAASIAAMVPGDGRIAETQVKEQAAKDAAAVAAEARTLMADIKL
ncbi:hypothetical protein N0V87_003364 [Didymella glomerata]|jgi:hypothetical protein|uniref:Uncharacterized protein n=1 Tax=Didymella glomerata TaxID=749621 RepID=A0A9W8X3B0_9PLEO|nr:hypothetical protein N0V87_003364 [Didymella glomerata]